MEEDFEDLAWALTREAYDAQKLVEKHKEELASKVEELSEVKATEKSAAKIEMLRSEITQKVRSEFTLEEGTRLFRSSPFISETVEIDGVVFDGASFIAHKVKKDPAYDEKHLELNPYNEHWQLEYKTRGTKFISAVKVTGCLIVAASGPGICYAYLIIIKGRASPLIFFNGDLSDSRIISALQLEDTSLAPKYVAEAFRRSLLMCSAVFFYSPPAHAGWCWTPNGDRIFCSTVYDNLMFKGLYKEKGLRNVYEDIVLDRTNRTFEEVVTDYHNLLPDRLPFNIGTVISVMSRLLPHFQEEGLTQDRTWVIETANSDTAKVITAFMLNKNHHSIEALFSSKRIPYIEEQIKMYVDCVMIIRHSSAIGSKYKLEIIQELLYEILENSHVDDSVNRMVPVLIIDNAGVLSEELAIHQLSLIERLSIDDYEQTQRILGELDYHIVKLAERNPDAVKQRIKAAIIAAKEMVTTLPRRSQSNSAIMFMSVAILLKEGGVLTETDVQAMLQWLRNEVKGRTSMGRSVCKAVGTALNDAIYSGRLSIAKQYGPPFWDPDKAFVATDDSINVTKEIFDDDLLADVSFGRNTVLQYLLEEDVLFKDEKSKGEQKTWTVKNEGGISKSRRFYSLSRDLLSPEANRIVDEAIASDLFHKLYEPIGDFFPFVKHPRLDMYAGQAITDYKHGTPFIAVTSSQGAGKTDWMMMQMLQRAKAGDVVVVLDPTNAFCREELSGHKIPDNIIDELFEFLDLSTEGWPVNIMDFDDCENTEQRVQKLSSLLISGMHLTGANQKFILVDKLAELLEKNHLSTISELAVLPAAFDKNDDEKKLASRLRALFSTVKMHQDTALNWGDRLSAKGKILVISSGNATINPLVNSFDIILDTLYSYKDKNRDGKMTVLLDEVQTFNHHKDSTLVNILSRVRKLDISVILASQDYLNTSLSEVYKYCGTHILFRPLGEECIKAVAEYTKLDINVIKTLPDFHCAIMGSIYSEYYKKNIQLGSAVIGVTYRPPYVGRYDDEQ